MVAAVMLAIAPTFACGKKKSSNKTPSTVVPSAETPANTPGQNPIASYSPVFAPAALSLVLPDSLDGGNSGAAGLRLIAGDEQIESQGLRQIADAFQNIEMQVSMVSERVYGCDMIFERATAACAAANTSWTECTAAAGQFPFKVTPEYAQIVVASMGEDPIVAGDIEKAGGDFETTGAGEDFALEDGGDSMADAKSEILKQVGTEIPNKECKFFRSIANDVDGLTAGIATTETKPEASISVYWNDARTKVRTEVTYRMDEEMTMPSKGDMGDMDDMSGMGLSESGEQTLRIVGDGKMTLTFDSVKGTLSSFASGTDTSFLDGKSQGTTRHSDRTNIASKTMPSGKVGVAGSFEQEYSSDDMTFAMSAEFAADDAGGSITTKYVNINPSTALTLSGNVEADKAYAVLPASVQQADADTSDAVGHIYTFGVDSGDLDSTPDPQLTSWWGPKVAPAAPNELRVWESSTSFDSEGNYLGETMTATALVVTGINITYNKETMWYVEGFDGNGAVTYACVKDSEDGACDQVWGAETGDYADAVKDADIGAAAVTLSGGATAQSLGGMSVLIVRANVDLSGVDPMEFDYSGVIGHGGYYSEDPLSASSLDGYGFSYFGTDEELAGAKVYKYDFDGAGQPIFTLLTGITVVKP